jgi:hypothetical protein
MQDITILLKDREWRDTIFTFLESSASIFYVSYYLSSSRIVSVFLIKKSRLVDTTLLKHTHEKNYFEENDFVLLVKLEERFSQFFHLFIVNWNYFAKG